MECVELHPPYAHRHALLARREALVPLQGITGCSYEGTRPAGPAKLMHGRIGKKYSGMPLQATLAHGAPRSPSAPACAADPRADARSHPQCSMLPASACLLHAAHTGLTRQLGSQQRAHAEQRAQTLNNEEAIVCGCQHSEFYATDLSQMVTLHSSRGYTGYSHMHSICTLTLPCVPEPVAVLAAIMNMMIIW